jgi:starvation-inducible outer membrane lipoprotein
MSARWFSDSDLLWIIVLFVLCVAVGCSPVPRKYLREAESGVTLTTILNPSNYYQDKLVILGGTITEEEIRDGRLWLHVRNRPLDQDYRPQLPPSPDDPEGGPYWVVVGDRMHFPDSHRHWGDMIVVGRVAGVAPGKEPILNMVFVRGWGLNSAHDEVWEDLVDANYVPLPPASTAVEMGR